MIDGHEMGPQDTFLMGPPREPINKNIDLDIKKWGDVFAEDQAKAFDFAVLKLGESVGMDVVIHAFQLKSGIGPFSRPFGRGNRKGLQDFIEAEHSVLVALLGQQQHTCVDVALGGEPCKGWLIIGKGHDAGGNQHFDPRRITAHQLQVHTIQYRIIGAQQFGPLAGGQNAGPFMVVRLLQCLHGCAGARVPRS